MKNLTSTTGPINGYYLYEITDKDLTFVVDIGDYRIGNVLLFNTNGKGVRLGRELARAANERAAREYIASLTDALPLEVASTTETHDNNNLSSRLAQPVQDDPSTEVEQALQLKDAALQELTHSTEEAAQQQKAQYEQIIDSLRTHIEEQTARIGEQSKRIDELSYLSLLQDEERQIKDDDFKALSTLVQQSQCAADSAESALMFSEIALQDERRRSIALEAETATLQHDLATARAQVDTLELTLARAKTKALPPVTMVGSTDVISTPSGDVHVYHEFPPVPKKSLIKHAYSIFRRFVFFALVIVFALWVFYSMSMFDTMRESGVPVSEYSAAIIDRIKGFFGL